MLLPDDKEPASDKWWPGRSTISLCEDGLSQSFVPGSPGIAGRNLRLAHNIPERSVLLPEYSGSVQDSDASRQMFALKCSWLFDTMIRPPYTLLVPSQPLPGR